MRRSITLMLLVLALFSVAAASAAQSEVFVLRMPQDFRLGWQKGTWYEWIPSAESVEDWSQMITVQTYTVAPSVTQSEFLQGIAARWMKACPETPKPSMFSGQTNGYPVSMLLLSCPHNAQTGKPETTALRVILGNERLYSVQRAFRSVPQPEQLAVAMKFLGTVTVCDTTRPDHPCAADATPFTVPSSTP
jgi:hypothetical protein